MKLTKPANARMTRSSHLISVFDRPGKDHEMAFGNLAARPDLRPLFGDLSAEQNDELLDRFLAIDAMLVRLAEQASAHVGVLYKALGLSLVNRSDGTSAGIHGGPSGDAGDIWFDISPTSNRISGQLASPSWTVESYLVVFCSDSPEPRGSSNTHHLVRFEGVAYTPAAILDILTSHVSMMTTEVEKRPRELFTMTPHDQMPSPT